ncbi:DUF2125 domain-containing protein [Ancylobacter sp. TS-1]|uniref:DUF2125 domain-containing protein n=1 Tax=Ancylobacter sp. TS-1 TaxID=1850374 RepID=UPI001265B8B5|nr:DUF2125 domain-containing protein [Ancylobacter sp. TS-1]QFR33628.1 DUF2125 domain-containing protein [Ancylobacter sp. TS-1]
MSPHDPQTPPAAAGAPPARRRPWLIAVPTVLIVLAGLGWSAAWFYASGRASAEIDAWIAREATEGRNWACASRELGGFPFRFELVCADPTVTFAGPGGWTAKMARAHAVAQVWNPNHIIAEFEGPSTLVETATGREVRANWSLLQVSGVGNEGRAERVSISANDYSLAEGGTTVFAARHAELHVRHHPGQAVGTLDIAFGFKGATGMMLAVPPVTPASAAAIPATPAPAVPPSTVDGEVEATVTGVPPFRAMPAAQRLALWQQAGGRVDLQVAKVTGGGGALTASGDLGLDLLRRPDGRLNLSLVKAQPLFAALVAAGLMPDFIAGLAPALLVAGLPTTVDGQKASSFPFVFRDGRVALGVLPLGKIGPLF